MRKVFKKIHLWLTLIFFLPLVIQGLTGAVLVFEHEIEDLISKTNQEFKLSKISENQTYQSEEKIISAAKNSVSKNHSLAFATFPKNEPALIVFSASKPSSKKDESQSFKPENKKPMGLRSMQEGSRISVFVNPFTLEIFGTQKSSEPNVVLQTINQLHKNLLISGKTGRQIIGYIGVIMLIMLISGIIIWFPKQMSRLKDGFFFRMSDVGYNFHKGLHKAAGIWTYLIFFTVTFSGVYIALPQYIEPIFSKTKMRERITLLKQDGKIISVDEAIAITKNIFKEEKINSIFASNTYDRPYRISLEPDKYITGAPMINVNINPISGEIVKIQNPHDYTIGQTILAWQTPLHYGQAFGMWYKILVFITGFLPLLFTITGITMWWKKKQGKKKIKLTA